MINRVFLLRFISRTFYWLGGHPPPLFRIPLRISAPPRRVFCAARRSLRSSLAAPLAARSLRVGTRALLPWPPLARYCCRRRSLTTAVADSRSILPPPSLALYRLAPLIPVAPPPSRISLPLVPAQHGRSLLPPLSGSRRRASRRPSLRRRRSPLPPLLGSRRRPRQAATPALAAAPPTDRARPWSAPPLRRSRASAVTTKVCFRRTGIFLRPVVRYQCAPPPPLLH